MEQSTQWYYYSPSLNRLIYGYIYVYLSVYLFIYSSIFLSIYRYVLLPNVVVCDVGGAEVHENGSIRGEQGVDTSTNQN